MMSDTNPSSSRPVAKQLIKKLQTNGMRLTQQRRAILRALSETKDHPNAEELLKLARQHDDSISISTVYRTLAMLEQNGAVLRNEFDGEGARFELADSPHHDHLIDVDTGQVIEFTSEKIERLQTEIADELGFDLVHHKLELYGRKR